MKMMDYLKAFQQGVYGFVVFAAFLLCAVGLFVVLGMIASIFGRAMHRLDDGGNK